MNMPRNRRAASAALACLPLIALAACGGGNTADAEADGPLEVLFVSGVTGLLSGSVGPVLTGVEAHVDAINEDGGIDGRMIELTVEDNQSDPTRGATIVQEALSGDKPDLVIPGISSNEVMASAALLARNEVVGLTSSSSQLLDDVEKFPYFFSNSVTTDPIVRAGVDFILGHSGVEKIVLVVPDDAIGEATTLSHERALEGTGVEMAVTAYQSDAVDVAPTFQKALAEEPDWIVMEGAGSQAATILASRLKAGAEKVPTLAAVVASNQPLLEISGPGELENVYATLNPLMAFIPEDERGDQFNDLLDRVTAEGPLEGPMSLYASGWDYIGLWADAVRSIDGEVTGPAIKKALETIDPDGKDPQFPMYSGGYSADSHFHEGPPEEFTFGVPVEMKDGMYVLE